MPELHLLNLLTTIDQGHIEILCTQYSLYRLAEKDVRENGLITENKRNGKKPNPSIAIARESAKLYKSIAVEFGLTPSSRVRIDAPGQPDDEEAWQKYLEGE